MSRGLLVLASLTLIVALFGAVQVLAGRSVLFGDSSTPEPTPSQVVSVVSTSEPTRVLPDGDVPGEDLADLPRYPGSIRVLYRQTVDDDDAVVRLEYLTRDGLELVHAHFRAMIDRYNWSLADLEFGQEHRYFFVFRGTTETSINLSESVGQTIISISYSVPVDEPVQPTATRTPTATPVPQPSPSPTSTPTAVPTPSPTSTPTPTPVVEPEETSTPVPPPVVVPDPPATPVPAPPPPVDEDDDDDVDFDDDDDD